MAVGVVGRVLESDPAISASALYTGDKFERDTKRYYFSYICTPQMITAGIHLIGANTHHSFAWLCPSRRLEAQLELDPNTFSQNATMKDGHDCDFVFEQVQPA